MDNYKITATGRFDENGEHHLTFNNGTEAKDPALISGAEAKLAWANGVDIQIKNVNCVNWYDLDESKYNLDIFDNVRVDFRLKPQTIKLELEIPAPYKAKIGGRDDTSFVLNIGRHQYCYKNEDDYTKARDALEAVFDSALRGTNS
ncbi:hypothetical protein NNO92_15190 [Acinetobacter baumannii]|nr:hypothetical protein [Acinetobacter baumannii]MCQ1099715.1 hypothetical protein [Acinetobacter baumannii]